MRPKLQEGAEIRKSEEETGNERVLEKRMVRRGREYESGSGICGDSLTSPWLGEHTQPWIRYVPVCMSVPAIFSSDVIQVTGVSLGQLPHSPEETFYYLP